VVISRHRNSVLIGYLKDTKKNVRQVIHMPGALANKNYKMSAFAGKQTSIYFGFNDSMAFFSSVGDIFSVGFPLL